VPYVYINGSMVGGCNDTKDLIATGKFDSMVGDIESEETI
jgi:glutaredoxin-related protein